MANTGTFRSAINGFNRQDVMDYLESASQRYETLKKERNELDRMRVESQARVKELEEQQEEAAAIREQASQEVSAALEQLRTKEEECETLRASLEEMAAERDAALARPAEDPAVAESLRSEVSELKARLAALEASRAETLRKAQEYDSMRDRIATLELNASRRAADIEDAARSEARAIVEQAEQQARDRIVQAQQEADALLARARQDEADFLVKREENYRSFRDSLQGAAQETEASSARLSEELQRLGEKLQGITAALTDTALRFEPAGEAEAAEACCDAPCCEEADAAEPESQPEPADGEEIHHCHE